jgi:L-fuconolactonase
MLESHPIPILDSHQHFWIFEPARDHWITDQMALLRNNFLPEELQSNLSANNILGTIAVQADQSELETEFLLHLAAQHPFIRGIVGWVDLMHPDLTVKLKQYQAFPVLKGFRHILQSESPEFMLQPPFVRGLQVLSDFGYTYDLLIYPTHLKTAVRLIKQIPSLKVVVDHLAKPDITRKNFTRWEEEITELASLSQVYCKISGMVTEADWHAWNYEDFVPVMNTVVNSFGTSRIMLGTDWPVCLLAASYQDCIQIGRRFFGQYSLEEQEAVFFKNAAGFYGIQL